MPITMRQPTPPRSVRGFAEQDRGSSLRISVFVPTIDLLATLDIELTDQADDAVSILFLSRGPPAISK